MKPVANATDFTSSNKGGVALNMTRSIGGGSNFNHQVKSGQKVSGKVSFDRNQYYYIVNMADSHHIKNPNVELMVEARPAFNSLPALPAEKNLYFYSQIHADANVGKKDFDDAVILPSWSLEEIRNNQVRNEVTDGARLQAAGSASIAVEQGGNLSGALIQSDKVEFFQIPNRVVPMLVGDFSISLFAQFEWLQNFALISATRFDNQIQGDSFTLQSYASYRASGLNGTGLHAVLRDPPAWEGGFEVYGNTLLRPHFWHHIAATRKADQLTLYLDGVKVGSRSTGAMPLNYGEIFVGRLNGNAGQSRNEARGLVGYIDELAVFANVLTDKQIAKLANPARQ